MLFRSGERGPLFIAVRGPLTIAASLVVEHRLQTRRLSNCGSRAQPLRGTWDPPRPGLEPASPALAGRLPTAAPPGKPHHILLYTIFPSIVSSSTNRTNSHCRIKPHNIAALCASPARTGPASPLPYAHYCLPLLS